jgi:hypothetical protein
MIQLPQSTEKLLIHVADFAGESPISLLDRLLAEYLEDAEDLRAAKAAMLEEGSISLQDFRAEHGV